MTIKEAIEILYKKPTETECKEIAALLKNLNEMHERACNDLHDLSIVVDRLTKENEDEKARVSDCQISIATLEQTIANLSGLPIR